MKRVKEDLEDSRHDPKALQRKLNRLLGKSENILPDTWNTQKLSEDFADYFSGKVQKIRTTISEERNHSQQRQDKTRQDKEVERPALQKFEEISEATLKTIIKDMPDKTCDLDPLPTWLVKHCLDDFAPVLTKIVNLSLRCATVPRTLQQALVFPTVKNANGDRESLANYRPVSNLPFVSKVLEKVVLEQLNMFLNTNGLLNKHQSGYRTGHSCETLLMGMFDDLLLEVDRGNVVGLFLLDMSPAFDTVNHVKLL